MLSAGTRCLGAFLVSRSTRACHFIRVPFLAVAPILGVQLVPLAGHRLAFAEAAQLLVLAEVEPEFHAGDAVARELLLEIIDFIIRAPPLVRAGKANPSGSRPIISH